MTSSVTNPVKALGLIVLGLAIATMGFYVANADDAPGAAVIGFLLMVAAVLLAVMVARNRLPIWAGRIALAVGVVIAAFAALLSHAVTVAAPPFAQTAEVPSVGGSVSAPQWERAIDRARSLARAAIVEQKLPGVSIAVSVGEDIVWAEGFGWRDVATETPVTPDTRFNIGTAAPMVAAADSSIALTHTGTDSASVWSPGHIGEPEEDFPLFTLVHDIILRPLGLSAPAKPLPGDRATFYVPISDDNDPRRGRRLMYMRDLACCVDGMTFYSTTSDLVRFAKATNAESVNGDLAGGSVMSLVTLPDSGIAVAVTSNIAYANTPALAQRVAEVFAQQE